MQWSPSPVTGLLIALIASAWHPNSATAQVAPNSGVAGPAAWASLTVESGRSTQLVVTGETSLDTAIEMALTTIAGRAPQSSEYTEGWVQWTCELPAPARGQLTLVQHVDLGPLLEALETAGQPTLTLMLRHPPTGFVRLSGAQVLNRYPGMITAVTSTAGPHQAFDLETGWRPADVARVVAILSFILIAPLLLALAVLRRSMAHDRVAEAWFGRAQTVNVIAMTGWVLWMIAVQATRAPDLAAFAMSGGASSAIVSTLWWIAFLPTTIALMAIGRDMTRRLRGYDPLPRGLGLSQPRVWVPLVLLVVSLSALGSGNARVGVFALLASLVSALCFPSRGPLGLSPQALSSGALRDRLFEMARRAGVRLRDLYIVPMRRERMANAFAVHGGVVMVADELLDRMTRREVDAILAHEISHLEHHHPVKIALAAVAVCSVAMGLSMSLGLGHAAAVGVSSAWLTLLFVSRRCEFRADADAAALTGDPEAMISSLGHLARINDMPLTWGRGAGWLITHPSTEARGLRVGQRAGLAPERVRELLKNGIAPGERYGHAQRPGEERRVFSTAWKTAVINRLSLAMLAAAVVAPAAALALGRVFGFEPPHAIAILAGAVLGFATVLLVQDQLAARPVAQLEPVLRGSLEPGASSLSSPRRQPDSEWEADVSTSIFVALSPGDRARVYEGFLDWDLGLLSIERDWLCYRGEQIQIDLPRGCVQAIEVGANTPSWIRAPRVVVRWSAPDGVHALTLRTADARRVSAIGPTSRVLAARLEDWRVAGTSEMGSATDGQSAYGRGASTGAGSAETPPPGIGSVTSRTPAEVASLKDLPVLVALIALLSAGASFASGFDFSRGLDVFAAGVLALLAIRWPALVRRDRPAAENAASEAERRAA